MAKKKVAKRNPQDTTLRNLRAMKRRIDNIGELILEHTRRLRDLEELQRARSEGVPVAPAAK